MITDKRRHKRYRVSGRADFQAASADATGDLLDIGTGGILVRSPVIPPQGTNLTARFTVDGYAATFDCRGRVVRAQMDVLAVMFLEEPKGLAELLQWLEKGTLPGPPPGA